MPFGWAGTMDPTVLARYENWRRADNTTLVAVTDALNRLFSNDIAPLRAARDAGLAAVGQYRPLSVSSCATRWELR